MLLYLFNKSNSLKVFGGELFIKSLSTTPFQIVCELMPHLVIISKSLTGPDDILQA